MLHLTCYYFVCIYSTVSCMNVIYVLYITCSLRTQESVFPSWKCSDLKQGRVCQRKRWKVAGATLYQSMPYVHLLCWNDTMCVCTQCSEESVHVRVCIRTVHRVMVGPHVCGFSTMNVHPSIQYQSLKTHDYLNVAMGSSVCVPLAYQTDSHCAVHVCPYAHNHNYVSSKWL